MRNEQTGEDLDIDAGFVLNASGAWAAQIVHMAGIEDVGVIPGKGIMIAMNHRLVNTVINRCTMPADGDILVPIRTVSVIGTTDIRSADPDEIPVTQEEVDQMLDDGERLVPGFREARALRVWAGVRPLFQDAKAEQVKDTRDVSRTHAVVDHATRDGITGLLTMSGRQADHAAADGAGHRRRDVRPARRHGGPCTTAEVQPPGEVAPGTYVLGSRLERREETLQDEQLICECELIGRSRLESAMRRRGTRNLDDIRRAMRLGMGPCQGGFCIYRATGILHAVDRLDGEEAAESLIDFLEERWKGVWPILYGDQLRQARLDDWIFQGLLDVEHLPGDHDGATSRAARRSSTTAASRRRRRCPRAAARPRRPRRSCLSHHDVVVVGAGLAGLAARRAARGVRRAGARPRQGRSARRISRARRSTCSATRSTSAWSGRSTRCPPSWASSPAIRTRTSAPTGSARP